MATKQRKELDDVDSKLTNRNESNHRQNNARLEDEMMNLTTAAASAQQLNAASCSDAAERLALSSGANLLHPVRNSNKPGSNALETDRISNLANLVPRIKPHKICRHHQQQLRQSICSNHMSFSKLVSEHHHVPKQQNHAHQTHCVHHPAHPRHKHHQVNQHQHQHHDCASTDTYLKQPVTSCRQRHPQERPHLMIRRERLQNHHNHHRHHSHTDEDASRRRGRTQTTASGGSSTSVNLSGGLILQQQQQQQQQPTSKRTTMRFISQLYFLIHLSAILSLLLHHKNLVISETWRLHQATSTHRQATPSTTAQDSLDSSFIHLTRRHNEHNNSHRDETMPSHINQLPIPLMLLGTIRSFVPDPTNEKSPTPTTQTERQQPAGADATRPRRTLPQVLITPAMGSSGADILIRLFGYRHARWALHYFLAYLLCSSITMLVCLRVFRRRNSGCNCCQSERNQETGRSSNPHLGGDHSAAVNPVKSSTSPFATAFGGFYYRTRLDCTPVLVGSISLGFIQLIVIGLDIAAKVDWLSSATTTTNPGESNNNRWPLYLPFLQFAFVSLLMQFILSKVAKNNNQAATNSHNLLCKTRHMATPANSQQLLLLPTESKALVAAATSRHLEHLEHLKQQQQQQVENNGKRRASGLQNIALAHLLVTHILLWLMKLNSISLFQAIEQPFAYSSFQQQQHSSRSRPTLSLPTATILRNSLNEQPKLTSDQTAAGEQDNSSRQSRSRHLISTTTTTLPPRTEREFDRMEREINRPEREFNRTEMEKILRSKLLPSLTMVNLNASATTQQVSQHSPSTNANEGGGGGGQYRRSSITNHTDTSSAAHQRPPPAVSMSEQRLKESNFGPEGVTFPVKFTLEPATSNSTATANNDSILINKAQFANLIDLATKNVRFQVSPNSETPTAAAAAAATTTTSSTTTQRPQFKSSLPKRMTSFRQIQNKTASIHPTITRPPSTAAPTTTTTTRTPLDVTKIISLAPPKQRVKVQVSRDELTPAGVLGEDDYTTQVTPVVGDNLDNDDDGDVARRPLGPVTTERPFPSVDSDPPLDNRLDPEEAGHVPAATTAINESDEGDRATMTTTTDATPPPTSSITSDTADEVDTSLGEFDLPPVPNYDEQNSNETASSADPDEQSSQISLSQTLPSTEQTVTNPTERFGDSVSDYLVSDVKYSEQESSSSSRPDYEEHLSVSDYLLPIVYQYHILIIAILFNMWLDSLHCAPPTRPPSSAMIGGQFSPMSESTDLRRQQAAPRSRLVRSRSMESELANRPHRNRQDWEETSSTSSSLNSVRASSEQMLWVSSAGEHHQLRSARAERADLDSASISSIDSPAARSREFEMMRFIATHEEPTLTSHSACSVFFGLIIVSAALIVILLGVELLTILNQCATQLLSIMVCLVGLCLSCRSQFSGRKRAAADELARRYRHAAAISGRRRLLLSRKGASYLTNPHDIVFSGKINQHTANEPSTVGEIPSGANHRQCFHYLFLLAAYFCGVSIALNLGKQHSVQQLFPPHVMQFLQRQWLQATTSSSSSSSRQTASSRADSAGIFQNWGFFWSSSPLSGEPLSPMILFHVVLASKGLLLIIQVTLQTILIRSSCSQRATRQLRQVYTFLMFSNLSLWAMDIFEQQQHLQRHDYSGSTTGMLLLDDTTSAASVDRLRLITLDGFTQFASSIVTLSHLYHGLVFMQH